MIKINKTSSSNSFIIERNGIIETHPAIYYSANIHEDIKSIDK